MSAILLDTNVLSELMKTPPNAAVLRWFASQQDAVFFLSAITHAEILLGVACLPEGKRRTQLATAAAEMLTLLAASGFVVHLFPTGQGNVIGNPILPVIKLSANPRTVRTMGEHIDVDVSGLLRREMSPDQAGDNLLECMFRTANGRLTAAEALGHREFVLTRLYESA